MNMYITTKNLFQSLRLSTNLVDALTYYKNSITFIEFNKSNEE